VLLDKLSETASNSTYDANTKLKISYRYLAAASKVFEANACIKRYLFSHVQSNFINVPVTNWDMAVMLPTERFAKANKSKVFKESLSSVG